MPTETTPPTPSPSSSRTFGEVVRGASDEAIALRLQPHFRDWRGRPPDLGLLTALTRTARQIGANPAWVCAIVQHESGFCPRAQNGEAFSQLGTHPFDPTKAQGLLQFIPSTAKKLGTTPAAIRQMTVSQQSDLIGRYLLGVTKGAPADSLHKVAMAVFRPSYANLPPTTPFPSDVQEGNPGIITPRDYVSKVYGKLPMRLLEAIGRGETPETPTAAGPTPPQAPTATPRSAPPVKTRTPRGAAAGGGAVLALAALGVLFFATRK